MTQAPGQAFTNQTLATFTDPRGPQPLSDYSAVVNWGDGTLSTGAISGPVGGVFTVTGGHTYPSLPAGANPYTITVSVADDPGLGLLADDQNHSVETFAPGTNTVVGTLSLPGSPLADNGTGDVVLSPDGTLGFVTDFTNHVYVVNLANPASPTLANTISVSNPGEGMALTPDGKFLLVSGGSGGTDPLSVVSLTSQTEVHTLQVGSDEDAVAVTSGGAVLVTSVANQTLRQITIDSMGALTDTGNSLAHFLRPQRRGRGPGRPGGRRGRQWRDDRIVPCLWANGG